jgi:hypothetical protein
MRTFALAAVAVAGLAASASAQPILLFADLSGLNEVPPNTSPATGRVNGVFDPATNVFSFSWNITGLTGTPSAPGSHIHRGVAGVNGPVIFGFNNPGGSWPLSGSASWNVPAAEVNALLNQGLYFNFHTTTFPGGEVRGQIQVVPTPAALAVLGMGGLLAARRRR